MKILMVSSEQTTSGKSLIKIIYNVVAATSWKAELLCLGRVSVSLQILTENPRF